MTPEQVEKLLHLLQKQNEMIANLGIITARLTWLLLLLIALEIIRILFL